MGRAVDVSTQAVLGGDRVLQTVQKQKEKTARTRQNLPSRLQLGYISQASQETRTREYAHPLHVVSQLPSD